MARTEYSLAEIVELLKKYNILSEGYITDESVDEWAKVWKKGSSTKAPFEMRAILKADIDRAMQRLPVEENYVILYTIIDDRPIDECAFILKLPFYEIVRMQYSAIRKMAGVLHGNTNEGVK